MLIAAAQINFIVGDISGNFQKIVSAIETAIEKKSDLIVFSELAIMGYPPEDLLFNPDLVAIQNEYLQKLKPYSNQCDIIVGGVEKNTISPGKPYYNSAFFISKGNIESVRKTLLPNYDVFNESRFFETNREFNCIASGNYKIALTICEDIWDDLEPKIYKHSPLDELSINLPNFIINISASPYEFNKLNIRKSLISQKCAKHGLPALYLNQTGCNTELIFDGNSLIVDSNGNVVHQMKSFEEEIFYFEIQHNKQLRPSISDFSIQDTDPMCELEKALIHGIRDYFSKNRFSKAVLGSSGGIDSALVQTLASKALGGENVTALLMPSPFSSQNSIDDAVQLSQNLGNPFQIASISDTYTKQLHLMESIYGSTSFDITEENLQSRIRALTLMAFSNKKGNLLLNTSNKSELAVGYGTLYGDMCGALSIIGDLYKTQVYALSRFINLQEEIIPYSIIEKEPIAEIRPNQKDADSLPPYEILDKILQLYLENGLSKSQIVAYGFAEETVQKVLHLLFISEHKRFQAPPILKVSKKAFGKGRLIPLTHKYKSI